MRLLIVCTANICRSPMAEAATKHLLAVQGLRADVGSAGIEALPDQPAHPASVATVMQAGYGDLSPHRSRLLSPMLLREADFVLCMKHSHRNAIVSRTPEAAGRVKLLGHWRGIEIDDPVGGPPEEFEKCLQRMDECIGEWVERLRRQGLLQ